MAQVQENGAKLGAQTRKLHGRDFYKSIGSPKMIVAPMVDRSEFAWRMLTRSYMDEESSRSLLAYSPMLHARLFKENAKFRDSHFQPTRSSLTSTEKSPAPPWLDGNPSLDRPLFVQFCANKPEELFEAAQYVAPYCDAVDLNLGCPQGIARSGHYGAFLQEDWDVIHKLINKLHCELPIPVTAKMRILDTKEKTLEYAKMIIAAGASILTIHGRRREQKGQNTGIADWAMIRYLRNNLPPDTVIFANGNILNRDDVQPCLEVTGADGVMSAEGNLSDPTIFAKAPPDHDNREYWRGSNGQEGYRVDGVLRRYLDIIYKLILETAPPSRKPLYIPSDPGSDSGYTSNETESDSLEPPAKRRKQEKKGTLTPSLKFMQGHLFQMFRPFIATYTDIRDALSKCRAGDMVAFENVLRMLEEKVKVALQKEAENEKSLGEEATVGDVNTDEENIRSSKRTIAKYRRPWFICQPHIRPLPEEALEKGALQLSKKELAKREAAIATTEVAQTKRIDNDLNEPALNTRDEPQHALVCG